ncbi:MAG: DUF4302 domain-containing protein [Muribaculaceae bacterium]|nr:DUF4302 domain-containing protein [Muribaculaceae bacterium]
MKKFLNISLASLVTLAALSLSSCSNEVDDIFDEDAVTRLDRAKAEYTDILTSDGGKWQLEYYANDEEPGYIYLMTFSKDGSVTIAGNNKWINYVKSGSMNTPAFGSEVSMWEVIADNGPVLSFNTYNKYFHLFADPYDIPSAGSAQTDQDVNENGYGHEGDYEFDIMKYSGDTLYLTGKKYNLNMIMTRVASTVDDEMYMNEVVAMADSFFNSKIPQVYINLPNGQRWIVKEGASSILKMFREGDDEISTAEYHNVIITHDGLSFMDAQTLDGYVIKNFIRQADGSLLCRDDNQTTMTADELGTIFTDIHNTWRADPAGAGGQFASLFAAIAEELKAYNKSTLNYAQIVYNENTSVYELSFNIKKGSVRYNPTYYLTLTSMSDEQVSYSVAPQGDRYGETYAANCPSIRAFADAMGAVAYDLSANSLLSPVNMKLTQSGNAANYVVWNLQ